MLVKIRPIFEEIIKSVKFSFYFFGTRIPWVTEAPQILREVIMKNSVGLRRAFQHFVKAHFLPDVCKERKKGGKKKHILIPLNHQLHRNLCLLKAL